MFQYVYDQADLCGWQWCDTGRPPHINIIMNNQYIVVIRVEVTNCIYLNYCN